MTERQQLMGKLMKGLTEEEARHLCDAIMAIGKVKLDPVKTQSVVKKEKVYNQEIVIVAQYATEKVTEFFKKTGYNYKIDDFEKFYDEIERINRLDHKPIDEIYKLIEYLYCVYTPRGQFDWRMQVRSGKALRRHYEKIMLTINQDFMQVKSRQIEDVV